MSKRAKTTTQRRPPSSVAGACDIGKLSVAVITHAVSMLPTCDVARCARVSKTFRETTQRPQPWMRMQLSTRTMPDRVLEQFLLRAGTRMEALTLTGRQSARAVQMVASHLARCTAPVVTLKIDEWRWWGALMKHLDGRRSPDNRIVVAVRDWKDLCDSLYYPVQCGFARWLLTAMSAWLTIPGLAPGDLCSCDTESEEVSDYICPVVAGPTGDAQKTLRFTCPTCRVALCMRKAVSHDTCKVCGTCLHLVTWTSHCGSCWSKNQERVLLSMTPTTVAPMEDTTDEPDSVARSFLIQNNTAE